MKVSIDFKSDWMLWATPILVTAIAMLFFTTAFTVMAMSQHECVNVLLILIPIDLIFLFVLLFGIRFQMKITMKALELGIEVEKKYVEELIRKKEEKNFEEAEEKQRIHEIKLSEVANTIKVEVSDVRMLRA